MHLTRAEVSRVMPLARKGTYYVARPLSYKESSVTVLMAVRDMLRLGQTAREVKEMIKEKKLKINGRVVRDLRESLTLFSLFDADKRYKVTLLPTGRFVLEPTKQTTRIAKIIDKRLAPAGKIQINLHDGTNLLSKEKAEVGDSLELDAESKIVKVLPLKVGAKVMVNAGRNVGSTGTIEHIKDSDLTISIGDRKVALKRAQVVVI